MSKRNAKWNALARGTSRQFGKWEQRARALKRFYRRNDRYDRRGRRWKAGYHGRWTDVGREFMFVELYGDPMPF